LDGAGLREGSDESLKRVPEGLALQIGHLGARGRIADREEKKGALVFRAAEDALFELQRSAGVPVHVFRLPNVFGKWCRPNYNSAVATFCHNIARGLDIQINDP